MKKTDSISLAGLLFVLEDDAYKALEHYLTQIKHIFAHNPDKKEIIADIENSIASKFSEKLSKHKQVITIEDVESVIKEMGSVEDFQKDEETQTQTVVVSTASKTKKLYRDEDNQVVSGVCSGLAAYFGIDVVWVRLFFGLTGLTPLAAITIPLYFILWISMPPAKTTVEKMQMRGEPLTLEGIEETFKEKLGNKEKEESIFTTLVLLPFRLIAAVIRVLIPIVVVLSGSITILVGGAVMVALTILIGVTIFYRDSEHIDTFVNFPTSLVEYVSIFSWYFFSMIFLIFVVILGISIIKRKNILPNKVGLGLAGFSVVLFIVGMISSLGISGEQFTFSKPISKNYIVSDFNNIQVNGAYNVKIVKDTTRELTAHGPERDIRYLSITTINNTLYIQQNRPFRICIFCSNEEITIEVATPELTTLRLNGASDVHVRGFTDEHVMELITFGASSLQIDGLQVRDLRIDMNGSSTIELSGSTEKLYAKQFGANELNLSNLYTKNATIEASGANETRIDVSETLKVNLSGASEVSYSGTPKVDSKVSTASDLHHVGD
jgi:phage shock protein PspC (stress-responsive transcriptional regulator)